LRGLLEVVSEKEAKEMVRYTIRLQMEGLWENGLDLLHALERDAAFMINGAPRIDDPEGKRSTAQSKIMGEVITTCLATDAGEMEAVCINVVYYVLEGRKPEKWTKADTPERTTERLRSKKGVKTLEEKDKEVIEARKARRYVPPKESNVGAGKYEREMIRRLKEEPSVRMALATELGARVVGEPPKASGVICPSCGKKSIWFYIDVDRMTTARCNHQNSCGYWGSLYDLARAIH
tara:strand:- start:3349 stop:4053 length:705 start_codon:yes stop_codon:yes gene_type:complete